MLIEIMSTWGRTCRNQRAHTVAWGIVVFYWFFWVAMDTDWVNGSPFNRYKYCTNLYNKLINILDDE